ncbi:Protein CBG22742 [Caenorhabditis briggsae]|uniref:Protein CBG22742 n=1 Tax=Caenorhabditis briggsae TaxID=6238 RepID=A8Y327_CAEBR|nr:Protein CBG22742 [Caenorhabditis briggsae]CAP39264.2 Protein CBG22742 [Caenorhabditis briggsae]
MSDVFFVTQASQTFYQSKTKKAIRVYDSSLNPINELLLAALFRETYQVFRVYKYYIIAHSITCVDDVQNYTKVDSNVTSEFYVTFMWLPITYLPYDVYRGTGWLSQWGVSGVFQFYALAQFIIGSLSTFGLYISRFFAVVHMMTLTWSTIDDKTIMYQQNKKDALFKKVPDLPKKLGYFSTLLLFSLAYHGFSSTCATIIFTKQLRVRILRYMRCCFRQEVVPTERTSQIARPTTFIDTSV